MVTGYDQYWRQLEQMGALSALGSGMRPGFSGLLAPQEQAVDKQKEKPNEPEFNLVLLIGEDDEA